MIAILGPKEKIQTFKSLGLNIYPCDPETAQKTADQLTDKYKIIFYTQEIYSSLKETIARFRKHPLPCFVLMPSQEEKLSAERIRELIRKATGTDLLKK
jgi:vacuolar-type H+-ATPase subunit F/Vma7